MVALQFLAPLVMGLALGRTQLLLMGCGSSTILRMVNDKRVFREVGGWDMFIDARRKQGADSDGENVGREASPPNCS